MIVPMPAAVDASLEADMMGGVDGYAGTASQSRDVWTGRCYSQSASEAWMCSSPT